MEVISHGSHILHGHHNLHGRHSRSHRSLCGLHSHILDLLISCRIHILHIHIRHILHSLDNLHNPHSRHILHNPHSLHSHSLHLVLLWQWLQHQPTFFHSRSHHSLRSLHSHHIRSLHSHILPRHLQTSSHGHILDNCRARIL